ncbi:MAG: hypothetical protein LLG02_03410 [Pelosinus sp.]|nr:hypothetical protein [Pelosinus sp.]
MKRLINGLFSSVPDAQIVTTFLDIAADLPPDALQKTEPDSTKDQSSLS